MASRIALGHVRSARLHGDPLRAGAGRRRGLDGVSPGKRQTTLALCSQTYTLFDTRLDIFSYPWWRRVSPRVRLILPPTAHASVACFSCRSRPVGHHRPTWPSRHRARRFLFRFALKVLVCRVFRQDLGLLCFCKRMPTAVHDEASFPLDPIYEIPSPPPLFGPRPCPLGAHSCCGSCPPKSVWAIKPG